MRCPKCGFHSFDYLDSCKKCGGDLTGLKQRCKFQGLVAPPPPEDSPGLAEDQSVELPEEAEPEEEAIDFGFDVLGEEPEPAPLPAPAGGLSAAADNDPTPANATVQDPFAIDLAADNGLGLDQPFAGTGENLPDDDLPKLDNRFDF